MGEREPELVVVGELQNSHPSSCTRQRESSRDAMLSTGRVENTECCEGNGAPGHTGEDETSCVSVLDGLHKASRLDARNVSLHT